MRKIERMYHYFGHCEGLCKDCTNLKGGVNEYRKCQIYGVSASEATDWVMKWGACGMKNKDSTGITPIVKLGNRKRAEEQCEGQISLFTEGGER